MHEMSDNIRKCVILHNLTIDYEMKHNIHSTYIEDVMYIPQHPCTLIPRDENDAGDTRAVSMIADMKSLEMHRRLQHDLMSERWEKWFRESEVDGEEDDKEED